MAEEKSNTMNLDLNLGPLDNLNDDGDPGLESYSTVEMTLEDWLEGPVHRVREAVRQRQQWRSLWRQVPIPPETRNLARELFGGNSRQTGEGSVAAQERHNGPAKKCENGNDFADDEALDKEDGGKNNGEERSFFNCNICLDLAKDPVVTCCGHLFCWPCLYRWLNHHSDAKECPVCKGEVAMKNVTPIYGSGGTKREEPDVNCNLKIPQRPEARRVESWRQASQRTAFTIPMEERIRRLESSFDRREFESRNSFGPHESPERTNLLLNRLLTSHGIRRERTPAAPSDDVIDLTEGSPPNYDQIRDHRRPLLRRSISHRTETLSFLTESVAAERMVESYFHSNPVERIPELPLPIDDQDSVSSIAAIIHSDSQTVDNAIEINSTVSLSTSSSRRRNDASRISDVDSGDSRVPRRRRLN